MISSVKKTSLLVRITESETDGYKGQPVTGRLHISEMQEELAPGMISMKKYDILCTDLGGIGITNR